ncbi:MAG: ComF family protein [Pseudomonadota bacterium]
MPSNVYWQPLLDALLPAMCLLCRQVGVGTSLCAACVADLPRLPAACPVCASAIADAAALCGRCQRRLPPYTQLIAPLDYAFPVDGLLRRLKFHRELALAEPLAGVMAAAVLDADIECDVVVPVPLHWRRLIWRGFNQAQCLAEPLAAAIDRPMRARALVRTRATRAQSALPRSARRRNVVGVFSADARVVNGRHCLLVDDVVTSGATITVATEALLAAGARSVTVACVARA